MIGDRGGERWQRFLANQIRSWQFAAEISNDVDQRQLNIVP